MFEYKHIQKRFEKHKNYNRNVITACGILIAFASIITYVNFWHISPYIIYFIAMLIAYVIAWKLRVVSKNYNQLVTFLEKEDPEVLENEELTFFIDSQMKYYFELETNRNFEQSNDRYLMETIAGIKDYYDYLHEHNDEKIDEDMTISLQWYLNAFEKHKNNQV
jgi:hypothetical protein